MTTEPDTRPAVRLCCGKPGAWLPGEGKPQNDACTLCPDSGPGRYWRDSHEVQQRQAAADQG